MKAEAAADNLRGSLRDELGALPLGPDPEEAEAEPSPFRCSYCVLCNAGRMPSCSHGNCPNPLPVPCECGAVATVTYFGRRFCQPCVDFMEDATARPVISAEEMARWINLDF